MASKGAKARKVVNQEELRRLMREKKQGGERRVDSPFAKYSSAGRLSCTACNVQVKSEILWSTHILSKPHRDRVAEIKDPKHGPVPSGPPSHRDRVAEIKDPKHGPGPSGPPPPPPHPSSLKRKAAQPTVEDPKKIKASTDPPGVKAAGLGLLAGQYGGGDGDGDEDQDHKEEQDVPGASHDSKPAEGLPADFFDGGASHSGSVAKAEEERPAERKEGGAETLPEGFFDDPVRDAKVRNVDTPKDHMDKEWEEFQKEMRQVNNASDAIVAEEDEEGRIERQIDEIDEQIECFRRVEVLRSRQEAIKGRGKAKALEEEEEEPRLSGSEVEEEDEEELLHVLARDWRAKGALV